MPEFMDPTTDFGFKKLFGDEANKDLTISFLNDLLELDPPLVDLSFANLEQLPEAPEQRIGIYDLLCRDSRGNQYLVEMQKGRITNLKERLVYYSSFPITAQARKGHQRAAYEYHPALETAHVSEAADVAYGKRTAPVASANWNYELKGIYCIAIIGYPAPGETIAVNHNSIRNDRPPHELFYDKLKFVTVELAAFDPSKPEYSLDRHLNRWLYFLKYASSLDEVPAIFKNDRIMQKAFWVAAMANFSEKERLQYEHNLKRLRDAYAIWETYHEEGIAKGLEEGMAKGLEEGKVKGLEEGEIKGKIETLLLLFPQKLGPIPKEIEASLRTLDDAGQIQTILAQFMQINDWEALRSLLSSTPK